MSEQRGEPPLFVNVNMLSGEMVNTWLDALQASWPALQVCPRLHVLVHERINAVLLYFSCYYVTYSNDFML